MIINDLDDYYIVFDTKNRNTELDALLNNQTTKQQDNKTTKKNIFFFLFLFITNKIITFALANSSGQGENPDRRYSPRA